MPSGFFAREENENEKKAVSRTTYELLSLVSRQVKARLHDFAFFSPLPHSTDDLFVPSDFVLTGRTHAGATFALSTLLIDVSHVQPCVMLYIAPRPFGVSAVLPLAAGACKRERRGGGRG